MLLAEHSSSLVKSTGMATLLVKLGGFSARRWVTALVGWLLVLGVVAGLGVLLGGTLQDSDSIPGSRPKRR